MRIYCDGIFDLFHKGHFNHFKKIHELFNEPIYLVVGVISDEIAKNYKRLPILNENQRLKMILSTIYVDEAFITDILTIDEYFIEKYKIDKVVHAFSDKNDKNKQNIFYEIPVKLGIFIEIDYNEGVSTTNLINDYFIDDFKILENENVEDLNDIDFNGEMLVKNIIDKLGINKNDRIIEYGCGCGKIASFFKENDYYGLDNSALLVSKHIKKLQNNVFNFDASDVIFKNNYFDFVIINNMIEYLLSK